MSEIKITSYSGEVLLDIHREPVYMRDPADPYADGEYIGSVTMEQDNITPLNLSSPRAGKLYEEYVAAQRNRPRHLVQSFALWAVQCGVLTEREKS